MKLTSLRSIFQHKKSIFLLIALLVCTVVLVIIFVKNGLLNTNSSKMSEAARQKALSQQKASETIQAVEKLMEIPDEEPTVATVNDLSKLQGQAFFAKAEEGDRALFFTQAKKAILYRPSANKIIEVSALEVAN